MSHAIPVRATVGALLEREEARRREDLSPTDDDRPVMQRGSRHEDGRKELGGELSVHRNAGLAVVL